MENVWQYLRQNWLSNTVFENYDAIIDAACAAWRNSSLNPKRSHPSECATGRTSVSRYDRWYYTRLRRNALQGRLLGQGAARRRLHRGDAARSRHPLRRHQSRSRLGRMALPDSLLRPRRGGKSDQAAQGPARLRSHVLPVSLRQPGSPRPPRRPFWLMLAVRNAIVARPRQGGRRPRRNGEPRPPGLRMPERRSLRLSARRAHAAAVLNDGACAPARQVPSLQRVRKVPVSSR